MAVVDQFLPLTDPHSCLCDELGGGFLMFFFVVENFYSSTHSVLACYVMC